METTGTGNDGCNLGGSPARKRYNPAEHMVFSLPTPKCQRTSLDGFPIDSFHMTSPTETEQRGINADLAPTFPNWNERTPSPLLLRRCQSGSHPYNTIKHSDNPSVCWNIQQRRAGEYEVMGRPPNHEPWGTNASLLVDESDDQLPLLPMELGNAASLNFSFIDKHDGVLRPEPLVPAPVQDPIDLDAEFTARIEQTLPNTQKRHGGSFSILEAMQLKDNIIKLVQMMEPSPTHSASSGIPASLLAGSLIHTPAGLAMLLIPSENVPNGADSNKFKHWTKPEDDLLIYAVQNEGRSKTHPWLVIASKYFPGTRTAKQCKRRWETLNVNNAPFTAAEDTLILDSLASGLSFSEITSKLDRRSAKQVRARFELIDPDKNRGPWTKQEELVLVAAQRELGNKWKEISARLPGRSSQDVKTKWHNSIKP